MNKASERLCNGECLRFPDAIRTYINALMYEMNLMPEDISDEYIQPLARKMGMASRALYIYFSRADKSNAACDMRQEGLAIYGELLQGDIDGQPDYTSLAI